MSARRPLFLCILLLLPALLAARVEAGSDLPGDPEGAVATCFDGDTLKLRDRRVIRLAGIDTPELNRRENKPQYYAREASAILTAMTRGQKIRLRAAGKESRDRYGRLVAEVLLPGGESVNEAMIARGAAFFSYHDGLDADLVRRLLSLQSQAIAERRGMWARLLSLPQAQETYVGNRNSRRFFLSDSPESRKIKPRNRVFFGNLMDAFMAGYAPARTKKGSALWPDS